MSHKIKMEFPWLSKPFVPDTINVYDLIDERIERLRHIFPNVKVVSKRIHDKEWLVREQAYLNKVEVEVDLGEGDLSKA